MLRRSLSQLSRLCLLASPLATATPTTVPSLVRGSLSHEGRCDPRSARHWCGTPTLHLPAAPVAPTVSPSTWRLPKLLTARCIALDQAADVDRCGPHHHHHHHHAASLPRLPCLSLLQCTTMLRPTRVLRCRNAPPSPPPSLDSSGFDLYEPGTWVHNGGNHATPDETILALTNCLEQQKTQLLQHEDCWEFVRLIVPFLLNTNPTVVQYTVSCIKTFLKPKPSGLPPLIETINNFDLYEPGTWVHFPGEYPTETEKITALTKHIEQHKDTLLIDPKNWVHVRTNIPCLFEEDSTATVTYIKGFLQPKPSGLPPLIEKINKLKAVPWDTIQPAGGVGFAGYLVLGLDRSDTKRFVLPESLANSDPKSIVDPAFAWGGVPSSRSDVTPDYSSVLVVTGESGSGKTTLLLLLLKTILERLKSNLIFHDEKFTDRVPAVTLYVTLNNFNPPKVKFEDKVANFQGQVANLVSALKEFGGIGGWLLPTRPLSAEKIKTLPFTTKRLLYHLVDLTPDQKQAFQGVAEDAVLRAALKSWKETYQSEFFFEGGENEFNRKIVRNYIMYEVLVEAARSQLQNTREDNLLPLLLETDATVTRLHDAGSSSTTKSYPSAVVVLAVDEIGSDVEASRALCSVRNEVYAALFGKSSNVLFRMAVAGTGLAASNLPPGSKPGDYDVHHVQPADIFQAHMETLFGAAQKPLCTRLISAVREQPYFNALTKNARMAALFAKQLKHVFQFTLSIPEGTVKDWVVSNAELQTAGILAAKEFKQLNGLRPLQIAKGEDSIFSSLLRAMALHMVPFPNNLGGPFDKSRRRLCQNLGLVTDRATWEKPETNGDVYNATLTSGQVLACPRGSSRYELNRGMLSILSVLVFGFVPQRSTSGEGLETAAAMTVLLIVAALRDMPVEALKRVLRYGAPLTPGSLGLSSFEGEVHFDDVCKAMKWKQPAAAAAAARTRPTCSLTQLRSPEENATFIRDVDTSSAVVAAALSPPKASFADAVVGLKHNGDKSAPNGLLVLIQSKDLKNSMTPYEFFFENHKMGHRGVQSIAGYLANTAPGFGLTTEETTTDDTTEKSGNLLTLRILRLAMFEVVPALTVAFNDHWKEKFETKKSETRSVPKTIPLPTDQDRINWLRSLKPMKRADIFACLSDPAKFKDLKRKFTSTQWAALPFVAPNKELEVLKAAYCAQHVMFVTYCTSESVPLKLRTSPHAKEVRIDWRKIRDKDIGIILSDSPTLLCTLPTNAQPIHFEATV